MFNFARELAYSETDNGRLGATLDGMSGGFEQEVLNERGIEPEQYAIHSRASQRFGSRYQEGVDYARMLYDRALRGDRRAAWKIQESMTTSDFALLFGDVLDRQVLANYAETPYTWDMYCKRAILNDFRLQRQFRVDRGAAVLDGPIAPSSTTLISGNGTTGMEQVTEYPERRRAVTGYTDQLYKFGCRFPYSFETIVNDDLDALKDTPALMGRAARRTEEKRATKLFVSSTGPNATFFSVANKNILSPSVVTGCPTNPALSIDAVMWALTVLASQRDLDGEPISIEAATLVYPPALKVTAENILNARELWVNSEGGNITTYGATVNPASSFTAAASSVRAVVANWAAKFAQGALNYYLPIVDTTSGNTAWYIFASPKTGRPALQQSFLRGREAPQMFMRLPNQVAIGEGRMGPGPGVMPGTTATNPMEGDFESDGIDYKIRHFLGGTLLDPVCAVASTGTGS